MTDPERIAARFLLPLLPIPSSDVSLTSVNLFSGTEAAGVYRVTARYNGVRGSRQHRVVVKHLTGRARRESQILQELTARHGGQLLPKLIGIHHDGGNTYLCLEEVKRSVVWPWRNSAATTALMLSLGGFHAARPPAIPAVLDWDYEGELIAQADKTRLHLDLCCRNPDMTSLRSALRVVENIVEHLPRLRCQLLGDTDFEARLIHGDVHPGNALLRNGTGLRPVLIDWGRARLGSPLEDVSSMLQSLRLYEPAALQRHDTHLKDYLSGMGRDRRITDTMRSAYWVAGASNALAGALGWHLMIAADQAKSIRQRSIAYDAVHNWLRVIRRAHAWAL